MDDIQAAKSVIKKLSALRATLLDEEQYYLDELVMGGLFGNNIEKSLSDEDSSQIGEIHLDNAQPVLERCPASIVRGKITWNNRLEIYELE